MIAVIGSGPVATAFLSRLVEEKWHSGVMIFERGNDHLSDVHNNDFSVCDNLVVDRTNNFGIGGNSKLWAGRLVELDIETLAELGYANTLEQAKNFYEPAYQFFGIAPDTSHAANGPCKDYVWSHPPFDCTQRFYSEVDRLGANLLKDSRVSHIVKNERFLEVFYEQKSSGILKSLCVQHVIICAGTTENFRILADSKASGLPLREDIALGKAVSTHPKVDIGNVTILRDLPPELFSARPIRGGYARAGLKFINDQNEKYHGWLNFGALNEIRVERLSKKIVGIFAGHEILNKLYKLRVISFISTFVARAIVKLYSRTARANAKIGDVVLARLYQAQSEYEVAMETVPISGSFFSQVRLVVCDDEVRKRHAAMSNYASELKGFNIEQSNEELPRELFCHSHFVGGTAIYGGFKHVTESFLRSDSSDCVLFPLGASTWRAGSYENPTLTSVAYALLAAQEFNYIK